MVEFLYFLSFTPLTLAKVDPFSVCPPQPIIDWLYFGKTSEEKVGKNENCNIGGGVQTIFSRDSDLTSTNVSPSVRQSVSL